MKLSEVEVEIIEMMASLFFTPKEILKNLEKDADDPMLEPIFEKAYYKGFLTTEIELRKSMLKAALGGSSEAQKKFDEIRLNAKTNLV